MDLSQKKMKKEQGIPREAFHSVPIPDMPLLPITSQETLDNCRSLNCGADIFICSYPKSGTTWLQNCLFQLLSQQDIDLDHISNYAPFFEADKSWIPKTTMKESRDQLDQEDQRLKVGEDGQSTTSLLGTMKEDREESTFSSIPKGRSIHGRYLYNTHLRYNMLPKGNSETRFVYIIRNGKDCLVSFYHHLQNQALEDGGFEGSFPEFFDAWCKGEIAFGKWFDHLMDYLLWSKRDPRILILFYEDLIHDLKTEITKIKKHCNIEMNEDKYEIALSRMSFNYMKANESLFTPLSVRWKIPNQFIRKGKIGDHQTLFYQNVQKKGTDLDQRKENAIEDSSNYSLSHYDLFDMMIQELLSQYDQIECESETEKALIQSCLSLVVEKGS